MIRLDTHPVAAAELIVDRAWRRQQRRHVAGRAACLALCCAGLVAVWAAVAIDLYWTWKELSG